MRAVIAALFLFSTSPIFAAPKERASVSGPRDGFSIFLAFGNLFGIGSARIGAKSWELGLANVKTIAINKKFYSGDLYAAFGPAAIISIDVGAGIYAGVGWEPKLFSAFHFRTEASMSAGHTGRTSGELMAGISALF